MAEFTPWSKMTPQDPAPSESGTKRDYGNMLNERTKIKKNRNKNQLRS